MSFPFFDFESSFFTNDELLFLAGASGGGGVEHTIINNPATFTTDLAKPLRKLLIPFTPVQAGTGDPSPTNVRPISGYSGLTAYRTGKNLYDATSYPLTNGRWINGTNGAENANDLYACTTGYIPCGYLAGQTVTLNKHLPESAVSPGLAFYDSSKEYISGIKNNGTTGESWTFAIPANAEYIRFTVPADSTGVQLEIGSSATAYEPYTGASFPVAFPALGSNQWDEQTQTGYWSTSSGAYNPNSQTELCSKNHIPVVPEASYRIIKPNNRGDVIYYNAEKQKIGNVTINSNSYVFTTPENCYFITFNLGNNYGATYNNDVAINYPSSKTEYEPYTTTAYGGELDALTGVLTVKYGMLNCNGAEGWSVSQSGGYTRPYLSFQKFPHGMKPSSAVKANWLRSTESGEWYCWVSGTGNFLCYVDSITFPDKATWEAYLSEHNLQICYELDEPFTVQLDPVTLSTLIGENLVWTDTNGDNTITYLKRT